MKIFLLILLFVCSIHMFPGDPSKDKDSVDKIVKNINEARRSVAKQYNISNMHELEYDFAMEGLTNILAERCPDKKKLLAYKQYEVVPAIIHDMGPTEATMSQFITIATAHLTNPVQTRIGFGGEAGRQCTTKKEYNMIFALGHENKVIIKHGTPGSQCNVGSVNKDGLCVKKA